MTIYSTLEKIGGCSLTQAFTQDDAEAQRSTQSKQDDQAAGLKRKKGIDLDKLQHLKTGNTVSYSKGTGIVVSKKGSYVTIYNEAVGTYDTAHVGETYNPGDTISMGIMNKLWDQMTYEQHSALLHKAQIQEPLHFISRMWSDIPDVLQEAIKSHSNDVTKEVTFATGLDSPSKPAGSKPSGKSPSSTSVGSMYQGKAPKGATRDSGGTRRPGTGPKSLGSKQDSTAHTTTSANSKRTKPTRVFRDVGGKKTEMTERQGKKIDEGIKQTKIGEQAMSDYKSGKATGHLSKAVEIYKLINYLRKVSSAKLTTPDFAPLPGTSPDSKRAKPDANTKVLPDQVRSRRGGKGGYAGQSKETNEGMTIGDRVSIKEMTHTGKSDVEHGATGGVVTDTPFDAPDDYEEDREKIHGKEFDHNTQQKTPKNLKDDTEEVRVGYHAKMNQNEEAIYGGHDKEGKDKEDEVEKEAGAVTTGTAGTNNPTYNEERKIVNKYNTRYGPRQATKEEAERFLNK